jgi:hypothetical protein
MPPLIVDFSLSLIWYNNGGTAYEQNPNLLFPLGDGFGLVVQDLPDLLGYGEAQLSVRLRSIMDTVHRGSHSIVSGVEVFDPIFLRHLPIAFRKTAGIGIIIRIEHTIIVRVHRRRGNDQNLYVTSEDVCTRVRHSLEHPSPADESCSALGRDGRVHHSQVVDPQGDDQQVQRTL